MDFKTFFDQNWPPIKDKCIAKSKQNNKISNIFTQYLENILHSFCTENDLALLREIRCIDPHNRSRSRKKLDYMICDKTDIDLYFFKGKLPTELRWHVCIEAQWDNRRFLSDFLTNDFIKLSWFPQIEPANQLKIAIAKVDFRSSDTINDDFITFKNKMFSVIPDEDKQKSHYLIYLFALGKHEYYYTTFDKFIVENNSAICIPFIN